MTRLHAPSRASRAARGVLAKQAKAGARPILGDGAPRSQGGELGAGKMWSTNRRANSGPDSRMTFGWLPWARSRQRKATGCGAADGQDSPRDNVVFEAGLFGGVLGMRRTFIVHASGSKLPTDLLGLTCVRYDDTAAAAEIRAVNQKLRKAIENEGRVSRVEGLWWQFSLTESDLGTRTHRSFTGPGRSCSSLPIAPPGTSRLIRTPTRRSTHGRPGSTCGPFRRT